MTTASFDSLLHTLYGCCADPGQWRSVLDQLRTEMGVRSAVIQRLRIEGERLRTVWMAQDSATNHVDYCAAISDLGNPRLERRRLPDGLSASGQLSSDETLFTRDEQAVRASLQSQLSRIGLGRYLGGVVRLPDGEVLALAMHRSHQDHLAFSPDAQQRVLALLPHLSQAVSLLSTTQRRSRLEQAWQRHVDQGPGMLLICDRDGRLAWCNRLLRERLPRLQSLVSPGGQIRLERPAEQRRLRQLLRLTGERSAFMPFRLGAQDCHLRVQALMPSDEAEAPASPDDLVLLSISTDREAGPVAPQALMSLFGLTDAEGRLLSGLVDGLSLQEYAEQRGVSVGTVRQQLKQVFVKTGAVRQSDLVRRVLGSVVAQERSEGAAPAPRQASRLS